MLLIHDQALVLGLHLLHLHLLLVHRHLLLVHLLLLHLLRLHLLWLHLLGSAAHVRVVSVDHLLLWSWHDCALKWIDVLWAHEVVLNEVVVEGWHATILDEVLHGEEIETLLLEPLQKLLLLLRPVVHLVHGLVTAQGASLAQLLLQGAFLGLRGRVWSNVAPSEVVEHLPGDLFKSLFSQLHRVVGEVAEWHELHNIGSHVLLVQVRI